MNIYKEKNQMFFSFIRFVYIKYDDYDNPTKKARHETRDEPITHRIAEGERKSLAGKAGIENGKQQQQQ